MNRGVIAYMREGKRCAKNTFKIKMNYFKFYLMGLVTLFGSLFIFTFPLVVIANIRMARLAERDEDIQIFKSFEKSDNSKTFFTVFGYYFMLFVFFLAGVVFLGILAGCLFGIGLLIGGVSTPGMIVGGVLAAPLAIALLVFIILFPFMMAPGLYLYDCNTNLGLSGMFYNSIHAMRKTGKWTIFMIGFLTAIRLIFWLAITAGLVILLIMNFDNQALRIVFSILLLGSLVWDFFRIPKIILRAEVAQVLLFNDICSTEKFISYEQSEEHAPKNAYGVSKRTLRAATKEQLLLGLFSRGTKLVDPVNVDQKKLPNEVLPKPEPEPEEDILGDLEEHTLSQVSEVKVKSSYEEVEEITDSYFDKVSNPVVKETTQPVVEETVEPVVEKVEETSKPKMTPAERLALARKRKQELANERLLKEQETSVKENIPEVVEMIEEQSTEEVKPKRGRKPKVNVEENQN